MKLADLDSGMAFDDNASSTSDLTLLVEHHRGELLRFLVARCGDPAEAEDCLQDLWIKASRQPNDAVSNARAYLFRMANNLVLDRRRAARRSMRRNYLWLDEPSGAPTEAELRPDPATPIDQVIASRQEAEILKQAINALPPGAGRALRLFRLEGMSQSEVAEVMGISRSGVEKHLALAMKHLRATLANCGFFGPATSDDQGTQRGTPRTGQRP